MKLIFSGHAWDDYIHWQKTDKKILHRINTLIKETNRNPFEGMGKPEPLKHALSGYWSRRITDEQRFIYKVSENATHIAQLRYHYCFILLAPTLSIRGDPKGRLLHWLVGLSSERHA